MAMIREGFREEGSRLTRGLIARGCVAIAFGLALLIWPDIALRTMVLLFGAYAFVDGVVALYTAVVEAPRGERWWLALHGFAGVLVGIATFLWTGLTALTLLYVIGTWGIVLGIIELGASLTAPDGDRSVRVMMGLHGVSGITFGVVMWWRPGAGALALITLVAAFAIVTGATRIALGIQLRKGGEAMSRALFPGSVDAA
jgi:uncharacterized membrane protein HdeD (DUF308 family)